MSETSHFLKAIRFLKFEVNPVFFVPIILNKTGFSVSKVGTTIIFFSVVIVICSKSYFITAYKPESNEYYIHFYSFLITVSLFFTSYIGYAFNSTSIANILNKILSQSKFIIDQAFCRRVIGFLIVQLVAVHLFPIFLTVWCCLSDFFESYNETWEFFMDVLLDYFLRIHLTSTTILFSDAVLLCCQIISKVNKELVKVDRIEWCDLVQMNIMYNEKGVRKSRVTSSERELTSMISMYDSVCQCCVDLNESLGCSLSCSYVCNQIYMFIVLFFITKYGLNRLWFFIFGASYNFLQNWILLYACETFTKEIQKTGIIVNRLVLETKSQRKKELLQQFSIFLLHRNIKFTAWGLFTLNYKLIYSASATMITYLTLVHQLDSESKGNTPRE